MGRNGETINRKKLQTPGCNVGSIESLKIEAIEGYVTTQPTYFIKKQFPADTLYPKEASSALNKALKNALKNAKAKYKSQLAQNNNTYSKPLPIQISVSQNNAALFRKRKAVPEKNPPKNYRRSPRFAARAH